MNVEARQVKIKFVLKIAREIALLKGRAYEVDGDSLHTFKQGEKLGMTKFQSWYLMFDKHICAIQQAIKSNPEAPIETTEGMSGRIVDSIVYLGILFAMLEEEESTLKKDE